jgi:hypothetical protein
VTAAHPARLAGILPARQLRSGSLCTGYGGLDLAVMAVLGARLAWCAESDRHAAAALAARYPGVPNQSPQVQLFQRAPQVELRGGCAASGGWWLEFGVPGAARSRRLILFVFDRAGGLR